MMKSCRGFCLLIILLITVFLSSCAPKVMIAKPSPEEIPLGKPVDDQTIVINPTEDVLEPVSSSDENLEPNNTPERLPEMPEAFGDVQTSEPTQPTSQDQVIENEFRRILVQFGEDDLSGHTDFLGEVKRYIRFFQTNQQWRNFISASLRRGSKYLAWVKSAFRKRGIPEDMAYIAFIESGFNPKAISSAGASGMWQFMPKTARDYSLKVAKSVDERFDPVKSTYAAIEYLHDLISIFGPKSFFLAMAAYNCGEGRVLSCLKEIENPFLERDFWHIRTCLPVETKEFPPKIIAVAIVGNNPEAFGFPRFQESPEDQIPITTTVENSLPKSKIVQAVYKETSSKEEKVRLTAKPTQNKNTQTPEGPKPILFVVKKGNTLSSVAEAFGVDSGEINKWNKIQGEKLLSGQTLRIYPKVSMELVKYTVKKGDTISDICDSFKVKPRHIITINGLRNGWDIKTGQILYFYQPVGRKPVIYTVAKGTNLTFIAESYNVTVKDLMMWNNLSSPTIYPQQKLKIYPQQLEDI
ncbi:MAG: LysM peptidoglycan-binding domain-containing protein [Deltaproteobacteria bacterium]|nr:LysM peptidoglycan-binding domain-containing protein [Deltaproteobacteria bacterium]